jgi:hypothetical protein
VTGVGIGIELAAGAECGMNSAMDKDAKSDAAINIILIVVFILLLLLGCNRVVDVVGI